LLKIQDAKKLPKIAICASSHNFVSYIFETKAHIDNRKKNLLSTSMSSRCPHNMVNLNGPLAVEIVSSIWYTHQISTGFAS